jgi:hypothetical protein
MAKAASMDLTTHTEQVVRNLAGTPGVFASASVQTWPVTPGPRASAFAQGPSFSVVKGSGFGAWWPVELGWPATTGAQNQVCYAFFPSTRRLAVRVGREVRIYDTGDHAIGGVFQPQGGDPSLVFASQYGLVRLSDLPQVWPASHAFAPTLPPAQATPPVISPVISGEPDVFAAIEKLAVLREKNILSEDEFSNKKAELLSRL